MIDTLVILNGDFKAAIHLERLQDMTLANIRKLFGLYLTDYRNDQTRPEFEEYLAAAIVSTKEAWDNASKAYASEFKTGSKTRNQQLLAQVKAAKKAHERAIKIQSIYQTMK